MQKNTICLWFNKDAENAARFTRTLFLIVKWVLALPPKVAR